MVWCLVVPAYVVAALALAVLFAPAPRVTLPRPTVLVRGCAATVLALIAVMLMGLALLLQEAMS